MEFKTWYTSKTVWGAIFAGAAAILNAFANVDISSAEVENLSQVAVDLVGVVGSAIAIYGRVVADKKIGG